jgi:hypothetical protein
MRRASTDKVQKLVALMAECYAEAGCPLNHRRAAEAFTTVRRCRHGGADLSAAVLASTAAFARCTSRLRTTTRGAGRVSASGIRQHRSPAADAEAGRPDE